jgi:hypothetical protein
MGLVLKALVAFCIGGAAMYGLQKVWLSQVKQQLATQRVVIPQMQMKPIPAVDPTQFLRRALSQDRSEDRPGCLARHPQPADQPEHQCRADGAAAAAALRHPALTSLTARAGTSHP